MLRPRGARGLGRPPPLPPARAAPPGPARPRCHVRGQCAPGPACGRRDAPGGKGPGRGREGRAPGGTRSPPPRSPSPGRPRPRSPAPRPRPRPGGALTSLSCRSAASRSAGSMVPRRASMMPLGSMAGAARGAEGRGRGRAERTWTRRLQRPPARKEGRAPRARIELPPPPTGAAPLPPHGPPRPAAGQRGRCSPAAPAPGRCHRGRPGSGTGEMRSGYSRGTGTGEMRDARSRPSEAVPGAAAPFERPRDGRRGPAPLRTELLGRANAVRGFRCFSENPGRENRPVSEGPVWVSEGELVRGFALSWARGPPRRV